MLFRSMRGGYPYRPAKSKVYYYIFNRKHGDLERDYNKFRLFASYFSEGEGNYRDLNQNRRIDLFFNPFIGKANVVYFLNLIKMDGYNPLVVCGEKLVFDKEQEIKSLLLNFAIEVSPALVKFMQEGFYLGELFTFMIDKGIKLPAPTMDSQAQPDNKNRDNFVAAILVKAQRIPCAHFGEGYWIDHWHYNLDLIENFLYFYPDKLRELFLETEFMFWDDEYRVKSRNRRYIMGSSGIEQAQGVEAVTEKKQLINERLKLKNFLRIKDSSVVYKTNLLTKLVSLILNKISSLDAFGLGVEMEADKPGWCDALNGLPSLDRKSTRLNSSHTDISRMPSSA